MMLLDGHLAARLPDGKVHVIHPEQAKAVCGADRVSGIGSTDGVDIYPNCGTCCRRYGLGRGRTWRTPDDADRSKWYR